MSAMSFDSRRTNALVVSLGGRRVGIINRLAPDHQIFSFEQEYIDAPERPTLSLSFKSQSGGLVTSVRPTSLRLPPFFSNLLPEGHLRTYLAQRAGVKSEREFFLLLALGADLPGAITALPLDADGRVEVMGERAESGDRGASAALRFSLAGMQLKFSAIMEASGGLTIPVSGMGGAWIVKLPSARFPVVPENEHVMLELARAVGIRVPANHLIDVRDIVGLPEDAGHMAGRALAVERFDRGPNGQRIHMEDFAQVFGLFPDAKYERRSYANIAAVLWAEVGEEGTHEFVRRLTFSVLIGNADMHLKNWSLLYADGRTPALSPAYDFVAALPYLPSDKLALSFGGSRSLDMVSPEQVRRFADTAHLPVSPIWRIVRETVERTVLAWKDLAAKDLLPGPMRQTIEQQILTVAANTARA